MPLDKTLFLHFGQTPMTKLFFFNMHLAEPLAQRSEPSTRTETVITDWTRAPLFTVLSVSHVYLQSVSPVDLSFVYFTVLFEF